MANRRLVDLETQLKDIRRQMLDQLASLEFRMESKLSLISEFQEFFKRRGEVEYEYARNLERICEKFEKNTKQRNIRTEVRSTFNLWVSLLSETRKMSRERAAFAEVMASEMTSRLDIMSKDVQMLTRKCKEMCVEIQDQFLKELRDLSEQTKVYQHSCHNTAEAHNKVVKCKEKVDGSRGAARKKKAQEKELERQKQYKVQRHQLMRNRNDLLLGISRCNSLSMQYFNIDVMDVIEYMDFDYHDSFRRLAMAYKEAEKETGEAMLQSADTLVDQTKSLNFENDLHYFLSEFSQSFTPPNQFHFNNFEGDDVTVFKVNTEDVFKRAKKMVEDLTEEVQTLNIQKEEDVKTVQHMEAVNLKKYQVTTVDDALAVIEENGDQLPGESLRDRGNASLERGLSLSSRGGQALQLSQKGKKDTVVFTLGIVQRRIQRGDRLALASSQLDILEKALDEQKVPPVPVGMDSQGRYIPGEVPKLYGGDCLNYIMATGCEIPLIVSSCCKAIERDGIKTEGLFRVPGPAAYTEDLIKGFEEGRDPLTYSDGKPDIPGVASALKAYFRELSTPLFPTDKYREFIDCTRYEDVQDRLVAIRDTIQTLHPAVIRVMKYLFNFLYRVSLHAAESRMGSANLALVFGPTLTRAPDSVDPRQLHNDVPSINVLIQLCIDHHEFLFGLEEEEGVPAEEKPSEEGISPDMLSTSPPSEPPSAPSSAPANKTIFENDFPAPPLPPKAEEGTDEEERPPERPPKPSSMSPPPVDVNERTEPVVPPESIDDDLCPLPETTSAPVASLQQQQQQQSAPDTTTGTRTEGEGDQSMEELDEAMKEIQASIDEFIQPPTAAAEGSDDESDSEDEEEEEDVLKIDARALHDYTARSDKELSFKRGDLLQVIEKTPDNNWWDGFIQNKRGFIPVAYIEILELNPVSPDSTTTTAPPTGLNVPAPPLRRSSMPVPESDGSHKATGDGGPSTETIHEGTEVESSSPREPHPPSSEGKETITQESKVEASTSEESPIAPLQEPPHTEPAHTQAQAEGKPQEPIAVVAPTAPVAASTPGKEETKPEAKPDPKKRVGGAVKSLTQQYEAPAPAPGPGRVLVEPHATHKRQQSDHLKKPQEGGGDMHPRSASSGSKVGMLSSAFENKASSASAPGPPPPIRPKPVTIPTSPITSEQQQQAAMAFPLMSHPGQGYPGVSPLQRAAFTSQRPAPPPPQGQQQHKKQPSKGSIRNPKRDKSVKSPEKPAGGKPSLPAKPPAPAKPSYVPPPGAMGGLYNKDLKEEMAARLKKQHPSSQAGDSK